MIWSYIRAALCMAGFINRDAPLAEGGPTHLGFGDSENHRTCCEKSTKDSEEASDVFNFHGSGSVKTMRS